MKIAIIGGGPAGMMAAFAASNEKNEIHIFEKNEKLGKKLYITGKGRCNITNNKAMSEILENVCTNKKFLFSSFNIFTNKDIIELLNKYGLDTKVERGGRVFPVSDKSSDVIKTFDKILKDNKVNIHLNTEITDISNFQGYYTIKGKGLKNLSFDKVIIACGGISYPATGSTGDGYKFAKAFNHNIIEPKSALVSINLEDDFIPSLKGVSLRNISFGYTIKNKKYKEFGELLFTDRGVSGPIILTASSRMNKNVDKVKNLYIDLKPALDLETIDRRLINDINENPNKNISNILENITIKALIPIILKQSKLKDDTKGHQVTKAQRRQITEVLKNFTLTFKGLDLIKYAIITSGGIKVKEINPSTMESKLIEGLYFAGEVIDVDAYTGGYNLQIAYSTGYVAGLNAGEIMNRSIAIDGPSGAGKSTIAKKLANKINFEYLDTGAMYRAFTYFYLTNNIDIDNEDEINRYVDKINLEIVNGDFYLDDKNINKEIRSKKVTSNVSKVSAYKEVRAVLVKEQRALAQKHDVVLDGRDIGSFVLPNASIKFYLDASAEERAMRRYKQLNNDEIEFESILKEIIDRDYYDSNREISPLKKADDAILIDSTHMEIDEVLNVMINHLEEKNVI